MATPTYDLLDSTTLGTAAASVTFSSISQDYRDLILVTNAYSASDGGATIYLNGDTGANYSRVRAYGNGSTTFSDAGSGRTGMNSVLVWTANTPNTAIQQIMDYSTTDKDTTVLSRVNDSTDYAAMQANRWDNTAAVTTIEITSDSGNFSTGSTFALYGIAS